LQRLTGSIRRCPAGNPLCALVKERNASRCVKNNNAFRHSMEQLFYARLCG
jgi:hypothetical protein